MILHDVPVLEAIDDCPHPHDGDEFFQESSLFVWHDREAGVGGFWRLGQEVGRGEQNSCFGVFDLKSGLRFRQNLTGVPMAPGDRSDTHMGCGPQLRADLDSLRLRADFPDCALDVTFSDFIPRFDWYHLLGHPGHVSSHFEASGAVTGRMRLGSREVAVNALGYRDRSWGPRHWHDMRSTRWWPSVFGPDLTIFTLSSVTHLGSGAFGFMVQDGVPQRLSEVSMLATLDWDAFTPVSGESGFAMAGGGRGKVLHEPADGIVLNVRGYTAIESIGTARFGERVGMSNYEICTNPYGGTALPSLVLGGNMTEGLTKREGGASR